MVFSEGAEDVIGVEVGLDVTATLEIVLGPTMGIGAVGLALTGRSMWSEGLVEGVSATVFETVAVEAEADITLWSSSSCSVGMGSSSCLDPSILSPHRVSLQSVNVPLWSLTIVSLTTTLHLPIPVSPLRIQSVKCFLFKVHCSHLPMRYRHESPVFIACACVIKPSCDA